MITCTDDDSQLTLTMQRDGYKEFETFNYRDHGGGCGYATPEIALSAGCMAARLVKERVAEVGLVTSGIDCWEGEGVTIVMHDGSTTTLGTCLRLFLPDAEVKRFDKRAWIPETAPWLDGRLYPRFTVMVEDCICMGRAVTTMACLLGRPIDMLITLGGKKYSPAHPDSMEVKVLTEQGHDAIGVHYILSEERKLELEAAGLKTHRPHIAGTSSTTSLKRKGI